MTLRSTFFYVAASTLLTAAQAADPPTQPKIPPEITAMLLEHRGNWRTEGWIVEGDKRTPVTARWECKAAVNGVGNVCIWYHEWVDRPHDSALDIMGYDPQLNVLRIQRVTDSGIMGSGAEVTVRGNTMKVVREWKEGDKTNVMRNEIVVTKPGEWAQHVTMDEDGKRIREITLTQRRVK